jgi:hypothetical protein
LECCGDCVRALVRAGPPPMTDAVEKVPNCLALNFLLLKKSTDDPESIWQQSRYRGRQAVLSSDNEVPHIFTRKSRVEPKEILLARPKGLFQQHRPVADLSCALQEPSCLHAGPRLAGEPTARPDRSESGFPKDSEGASLTH